MKSFIFYNSMSYMLRSRLIFLSIVVLVCSVRANSGPAPGIYLRTNQVGFLSSEPKIALALTNQNLRRDQFRVIKNPGGQEVFRSTVGIAELTHVHPDVVRASRSLISRQRTK